MWADTEAAGRILSPAMTRTLVNELQKALRFADVTHAPRVSGLPIIVMEDFADSAFIQNDPGPAKWTFEIKVMNALIERAITVFSEMSGQGRLLVICGWPIIWANRLFKSKQHQFCLKLSYMICELRGGCNG
jgi:hypothetical protein